MNNISFFKKNFSSFALYNLVFLVLQTLHLLAAHNSFLQPIPLPGAVYFEIITALFLQILLYIILSAIQTGLLWGISRHISPNNIEKWQISIYTLSIIAIITANCHYFPHSALSSMLLPEIPTVFLNSIMLGSLCMLMLFAIMALVRLLSYSLKKTLFSFVLILFSMMFILMKPLNQAKTHHNPTQPNIIILGIDSLNTAQINARDTPELMRFLKQSVHFNKVITPLARTSPSWTTILTGMHPLHHHARENLISPDLIRHEDSFAWHLKKMGYQTIFASDDRRFNSMGKEFGFNIITGPKIGANDFLLGSFYDFPLSNLLINLRISKRLFPYHYINRAAHVTYLPQTFDLALKRMLEQQPTDKPLFLAVHFTLPHWPYSWAASPFPNKKAPDEQTTEPLYQAATRAVDTQVGNMLKQLQKHGLLHNSMVMILSDHGETLNQVGSRQVSAKLYQDHSHQLADYLKGKLSGLEQSSGHGSDLLSPTQFECLLGIKIFQQGHLLTQPKIVAPSVSLMDIAPTIYAFLNQPLQPFFDGISLYQSLITDKPPIANRSFMLESGIFPNQVVTKDTIRLIARMIYKVNFHNNHLELRQDRLAMINAIKLYGILKNDWLIALYPGEKKYITVILNRKNGQWTDNPDSDFAKTTPAKDLILQLKNYYRNDLSAYPKILPQKPAEKFLMTELNPLNK